MFRLDYGTYDKGEFIIVFDTKGYEFIFDKHKRKVLDIYRNKNISVKEFILF